MAVASLGAPSSALCRTAAGVLAAAAEQQRREYEQACERRIQHALNNRWTGPTQIQGLPLLTYGQLRGYDVPARDARRRS